jgi:hypothetical protein
MTRDELLRQEIEKYKRKIATYQAMVTEWENELGIHSDSATVSPLNDPASKKKSSDSTDPLSLVQGMVFFRKSQPEAAKAFLEMVGYPVKTGMLLEAVEKGGVTVGGKTPGAKKQNLYTSLHRSPDFALAKKDTWGLVSWGLTKKASEEEEPEE